MNFVYISISLDGFHLITIHHLRKVSYIFLTACMVLEIGGHSVCSASQKLLWDCLLAIWLVVMNCYIDQNMIGLPCHLRREHPAIPHSMAIKVDVHSACTASLKWFCNGLLSGWCTWWNCHIDQKYEILHFDCRAIRKENTQLLLIAWWWRRIYN